MANSLRTPPPFRAEHIGSLLRPAELLEAHRALAAHRLSADGYREVEDQCIREAIRLQEEIGLESITDGEFRRASYFSHFIEGISGMTDKESLFTFTDLSGQRFHYNVPHTFGKLERRQGISTEAFRFLRSETKRTPKVTMPSPSTMHFWRGRQGVEPAAYPEEDEFFEDLVRIYQQELSELAALGAEYIQLDEVPLAMLCDPNVREAVRNRGEDPDRLREKYIEITNAALRNKPANMTVGMHLCRGNYKAKWLSEGGYDPIADQLFNQVNVDAFFLEYDTPRAGDFRPLRFVPPNKMVVLGLVSSKTPQMEAADLLKRRVDEASAFVARERLAISPQCGFGTSVGSRPVTPEAQTEKLRLVVNVARQIWG